MPNLNKLNPIYAAAWARDWLLTWSILRSMPPEDKADLINLTGDHDPRSE